MSKNVVLITGASSGLGKSIASYLAQRGFRVYGTSRSQQESSPEVTMIKMDVTQKAQIKEAIQYILNKEGRLDVLINNAGIGMAGPLEETSAEEFLKVFNTNVIGVLETCRAVLPQMRKQKAGTIINISSIASCFGLPYRAAYCASKAAVDSMTEAVRMEVKQYGIKVCSVQPGDIKTNISDSRIVSATYKGTVYERSFDTCYDIINTDVAAGSSPESFGPLIHKLIKAKSVKRAYVAGKPLQKLTVFLNKILPDSLFEKILTNYYKVS